MENIIYIVIQIVVMLLVAPLVNGIIKKIKAFSQKRKGPSIFQLYFDIFKLLKKDTIIPEASSWIFRITPYVSFASILVAALFIPVSIQLKPLTFFGDAILVIYLLAIGRFFMTLAGLDAGSTFGGMGSSREMTISSLFEPSLLVSVFTLGLIAKSTSFYAIMSTSISAGISIIQPVYLITFVAIFIILIAETARTPVDDPSTHLELTMVHEAMILEYSGRHLALMELGASVKQLIFITLLANIFIPLDRLIPFTGNGTIAVLLISLLLYLVKVLFIAVLIAVTEISTVKLKLFSVPNLAMISFVLSCLGFLQYFVIGG
jgi:formate hydrogenlyase subunit 4